MRRPRGRCGWGACQRGCTRARGNRDAEPLHGNGESEGGPGGRRAREGRGQTRRNCRHHRVPGLQQGGVPYWSGNQGQWRQDSAVTASPSTPPTGKLPMSSEKGRYQSANLGGDIAERTQDTIAPPRLPSLRPILKYRPQLPRHASQLAQEQLCASPGQSAGTADRLKTARARALPRTADPRFLRVGKSRAAVESLNRREIGAPCRKSRVSRARVSGDPGSPLPLHVPPIDEA